MGMNWPPDILDGLFCDKKDHRGIYYWYEALIEKNKFSKLKVGTEMTVTYEHI